MAEENNKYILYGGPVDEDPAGVVRSMGEYIIRGMTEQIDRIQWVRISISSELYWKCS